MSSAYDGQQETAWGIFPEVGRSHSTMFTFDQPVRTGGRVRLQVELAQVHGRGHLIGRPRLSVTTAADPSRARPLPDGVRALMAVAPAERSIEQRGQLTRSLLDFQIEGEIAALPQPQMVYAAVHDFKPMENFHPSIKPRRCASCAAATLISR